MSEQQMTKRERLKWNTDIVFYLSGELDFEVKQHNETHLSLIHPSKRRMDYWPSTNKGVWFNKNKATSVFHISNIEQYIYSHFGDPKKILKNPDIMENKQHLSYPLTKLELLAAMAPDSIPSWFMHTPVGEYSQTPNWTDIKNKEDRNCCREWVQDAVYDLPDHLKWFQDKFEKAIKEQKAASLKNEEARYFQWRKYYAENLLAELNKIPIP